MARSDRGLNVCSDSSSSSSLSKSESSTGCVFGVGLRGEDCFLGESSREFRFASLEGLVCCAHGQDMKVYGKGRDMLEALICIDNDDPTTVEVRVYLSHYCRYRATPETSGQVKILVV